MQLSFLLIDSRTDDNQIVFHCNAENFAKGEAMAFKAHPNMSVAYGCDGKKTIDEIQKLAGNPVIYR